MRKLILTCLCLLLTQTAESSNYYYPSYRYSYPVYQPPVVYNNTYYQPYAVPLYTAAYAPQTAVISGSVAYQQAITTLATAGAATQVQSTVQGVLGAEVQQQQQLTFEQRLDRLMAKKIEDRMADLEALVTQLMDELTAAWRVMRRNGWTCERA